MNIFILEWHWSDGYDSCNAVIGVYTSKPAAETAWNRWITRELGDYGMQEEYWMVVTEMLLGDTGHE